MLRALWRLHSRRRMLQWVTAADADKGGWAVSFRRLWYTPAGGGGAHRLGRRVNPAGRTAVPAADPAERPVLAAAPARRAGRLCPGGKHTVSAYAAAMWRYYEGAVCGPEDHYLPGQPAGIPGLAGGTPHLPPPISALYLLCIVSAADFGFIDEDGMLLRLDRTVRTVEKLEKWRGNLLNWYDTRTLRPPFPRYISTVDSGNLACCLVAAPRRLLEHRSDRARPLADRLKHSSQPWTLILCIIVAGPYSTSAWTRIPATRAPPTYDLLMSESRLTGYFAIATRAVPKSTGAPWAAHWPGRAAMWGRYPDRHHVRILHAPSASARPGRFHELRGAALLPALPEAAAPGVPWGSAKAAFYAFDSNLNYQYKAHGVPRLGLKRGLGSELVISPYSSFLTLTTDPPGLPAQPSPAGTAGHDGTLRLL